METTVSATKYVVYSKTLNKFWSPNKSGSLYYTEADFCEELGDATVFITQNNATDRAVKMKDYAAVVVPLTMTIRLDQIPDQVPDIAMTPRVIGALKLVDELNKMDDREENALSNMQIKKYKDARKYLKELGML